MSNDRSGIRLRSAGAAALALAATLALAACGGTTTSSTPSGPPGFGNFAARRTAIEACLRKHGVTLPGGGFGGRGFGATGAHRLPPRFGATGASGVRGRFRQFPGGFANPKDAKAIQECGGFGGRGFGRGGGYGGGYGGYGYGGAQPSG